MVNQSPVGIADSPNFRYVGTLLGDTLETFPAIDWRPAWIGLAIITFWLACMAIFG